MHENLMIGSFVVENGNRVYRLDPFLISKFNVEKTVKGHSIQHFIKNSNYEKIIAVECRCGSAHPFIEGEINWDVSIIPEII